MHVAKNLTEHKPTAGWEEDLSACVAPLLTCEAQNYVILIRVCGDRGQNPCGPCSKRRNTYSAFITAIMGDVTTPRVTDTRDWVACSHRSAEPDHAIVPWVAPHRTPRYVWAATRVPTPRRVGIGGRQGWVRPHQGFGDHVLSEDFCYHRSARALLCGGQCIWGDNGRGSTR